MGAFTFMLPRLERLARGRSVLSVKRSAAASPATGSHGAHEMEQKNNYRAGLRNVVHSLTAWQSTLV